MKFLALFVALTLASVALCRQNPSSPAWARQELRRLYRLGLVSEPNWRGGQPPQRFVNAVAAFDAVWWLDGILDRLESGEPDAKKQLEALGAHATEYSRAATGVQRLITEFRPELTKMGADLPAIRTVISTMPHRFQLAVSDLTLKQRQLSGTSEPAPRWADELAARLKSEGLLAGPISEARGEPRPASRWEFAVQTYGAWSLLNQLEQSLADGVREVAHSEPGADRIRRQLPADLTEGKRVFGTFESGIRRLIGEFYVELVKLGADPDRMVEQLATASSAMYVLKVPQIGEASEPFTDIPAGHWAAKAANELRSWGILHGYPDGRFRG